mmetsp:Transcript_8865/g.30499  ORF Transcript_8865/g.30499 Transcript_8865/m.30499 type:complete len:267 (+) Transcript_8865:53-853(+)
MKMGASLDDATTTYVRPLAGLKGRRRAARGDRAHLLARACAGVVVARRALRGRGIHIWQQPVSAAAGSVPDRADSMHAVTMRFRNAAWASWAVWRIMSSWLPTLVGARRSWAAAAVGLRRASRKMACSLAASIFAANVRSSARSGTPTPPVGATAVTPFGRQSISETKPRSRLRSSMADRFAYAHGAIQSSEVPWTSGTAKSMAAGMGGMESLYVAWSLAKRRAHSTMWSDDAAFDVSRDDGSAVQPSAPAPARPESRDAAARSRP